MTTLLDLIRRRRAELEVQGLEHLGPITDDDRDRAIQQCIADAPHDPAAAEVLRKVCALGPEVEARVKELAAEMQAGDVLDDAFCQANPDVLKLLMAELVVLAPIDTKKPAKTSPEPRHLDARDIVTKHGGFLPRDEH